jgi:hypothetical protein
VQRRRTGGDRERVLRLHARSHRPLELRDLRLVRGVVPAERIAPVEDVVEVAALGVVVELRSPVAAGQRTGADGCPAVDGKFGVGLGGTSGGGRRGSRGEESPAIDHANLQRQHSARQSEKSLPQTNKYSRIAVIDSRPACHNRN